MSTPPKEEDIISYYNKVAKTKLHNYLQGNPRVDAAWRTVVRYRPEMKRPLRVLEVGCGVGSICHKMHKRWPQADIIGLDISTRSIELANKLFSNEKVRFKTGILSPDTFDEAFDLIIFMDVYEHIAVHDRPTVHAAIKKLLQNKGRLILSVPTPHNLQWSAVHKPETMQPVDEHISLAVIQELAEETDTEVLYYEKKDIWNIGDYAHVVLEKNADFQAAFFEPKPINLSKKIARLLHKWRQKINAPFKHAYARRRLQ